MHHVYFFKIGYETAIGNRRWAGPVIATPAAVYCVLATANSLGDRMTNGAIGVVGGAVGGLIAGALRGDRKASLPTTATVGDLPEYLRSAEGSPVHRFKAGVPVLVIPRESVRDIFKSSWINNTLLLIQVSGEQYVISHRIFGAGRVRTYLVDSLWPLVWRGRRLTTAKHGVPVAAAVAAAVADAN